MQTRDGSQRLERLVSAIRRRGATWSPKARLSDVTSGFAYVTRRGFREPYGDYGEIAITTRARRSPSWGQGMSYNGPGGSWFNRQR